MEGAPNEQPPLEPLPPVVEAPPAVPPPVQESEVSSTVADAVAKAFSVAALPPSNNVGMYFIFNTCDLCFIILLVGG